LAKALICNQSWELLFKYEFSMLCLRLQFNGWMVLPVPIGPWKQKQPRQRFQKPNRCTLILMLDSKPVGWG